MKLPTFPYKKKLCNIDYSDKYENNQDNTNNNRTMQREKMC